MAMKSAVSEEEKAKTLILIKVYLLNMQKRTLAFSDKMCTEINGMVFEIDRALKKEKSNE